MKTLAYIASPQYFSRRTQRLLLIRATIELQRFQVAKTDQALVLLIPQSIAKRF
jgi:hypothetical protein